MAFRGKAVALVGRVLARRGYALMRVEDQALCTLVRDDSIVIPLPREPVKDEVASLRPLRPSDAAAVSAGATDPDVIHFALWASPFTEERARRWIEQTEVGRKAGQSFALAVDDATTGEFTGVIGVTHIDSRALSAEQFLWLVPGARRKGLGNHATLLLDRWIFERTPISRMVAVTLVENEPARRQLPTIGYTEEGVLRGGMVHYGQRHDAVQFSLLRSDLDLEGPPPPDSDRAAYAGRIE